MRPAGNAHAAFCTPARLPSLCPPLRKRQIRPSTPAPCYPGSPGAALPPSAQPYVTQETPDTPPGKGRRATRHTPVFCPTVYPMKRTVEEGGEGVRGEAESPFDEKGCRPRANVTPSTHAKQRQERFSFEKGATRGGSSVPPGPNWAEQPHFFRETAGCMVCSASRFKLNRFSTCCGTTRQDYPASLPEGQGARRRFTTLQKSKTEKNGYATRQE